MRIALRGLTYFALVFAVGFLLGTVRLLWLAPRLGERWAELLEMPVMVAASYLAARALFGRRGSGVTRKGAAAAGVLALGLLLLVELTMVLSLRGLTWGEYLSGRDPVAGAAYLVSLALFAAMPALVARRPGD